MPRPDQCILIVDPDPRAREMLAKQLQPLELRVLEASDGPDAVSILALEPVRIMITELYLETGEDPCLVQSIRRREPTRDLRIIAHTHRSLGSDRDWALKAGADAYLIKPTRAQRVRYVVGRLATETPVAAPPPNAGPFLRRDSLDHALADIERGTLTDTSCIVFGRGWWQSLTTAERATYRKRAKGAHVSLRSDSVIGSHFVEVRGRYRPELGLTTEQPESPYRR